MLDHIEVEKIEGLGRVKKSVQLKEGQRTSIACEKVQMEQLTSKRMDRDASHSFCLQ